MILRYPFGKIEQEYDEEGFRTRLVNINQDGKRYETVSTKLKNINQQFNNRQFSTTSKIEFTDANGNTVTGASSTYDRDGNEIETVYPFKGERFARRFDSEENQIEETTYRNGKLESIDRFTYEFDRYGNWTRRLTTSYLTKYSEVGFTPMYVEYREITYYGR